MFGGKVRAIDSEHRSARCARQKIHVLFGARSVRLIQNTGQRAAFLYLLLCCYGFSAQSHAAPPCANPSAYALAIEGRVEVKSAATTRWRALGRNAVLCPGDAVRIENAGRALLRLPDETLLRINQGTSLVFPSVSTPRSVIEILKGALHFLSRTRRGLDIKTPYVNAAIEGTEFTVHVDDDSARLWVVEGQVRAANASGAQRITDGQAIQAHAAAAPTPYLEIPVRDAARWALYYPPLTDHAALAAYPAVAARYRVGDTAGALEALEHTPASARDQRYTLLRAGLLLSLGQVDAARALLVSDTPEAEAYRAVIQLAGGDAQAARLTALQALAEGPNIAGEIALSYAEQVLFNLDAAHAAVERAARGAGNDDPLVHARRAELALMQGDRAGARQAAELALAVNSQHPRALAVSGFAALADLQAAAAETLFLGATASDPSDPLVRLGLGLARIRQGALAAGRADIEAAAALDPHHALVRSYLGKANYEERRHDAARTQYHLAQQYDPHDPTPWFYSALLHQATNQPVAALQDIEASIANNDQRAVYRSRLLLDQDQAARGASLARVYQGLGFRQRALEEGWRSLSYAVNSDSAHRLLADSYAVLPRHEIARVSELLQAQLLQPLNLNPLQPQLAESNLAILEDSGPSSAGYHEYNPLFVREGLHGSLGITLGGLGTWSNDAVLAGLHGPFAYSLGQFHYETDGFRRNNGVRHDIVNVFTQGQISSAINAQLELRHRESLYEDIVYRFDLDDFSPTRRRDIDTDTARIGLRYATRADRLWLLSVVHENVTDRSRANDPPFISDTRSKPEAHSAELQYRIQVSKAQFIAGLGVLRETGSGRDSSGVSDELIEVTPFDFNTDHRYALLYAYLTPHDAVRLTVGGSYNDFDKTLTDPKHFNPKLGLEWSLMHDTVLRLAAFRGLKRPLLAQQTLEPVAVAGFNQFFDDFDETHARRFGAGLSHRFNPDLSGGIEISRRLVNSPFAPGFDQEIDEDLHRAYLYWTPDPRWAVGLDALVDNYQQNLTFTGDPARLDTVSLIPGLRYFYGSQWSFGLSVSGVRQRLDRTLFDRDGFPAGTLEEHSTFGLIDAAVGYRLPKRRGSINLNITNLLDRRFDFQDRNFQTAEPRAPQFFPERVVFVNLTIDL